MQILKGKLRRAIDRRELQVHYQPKFHLETGGLHGVEALLRWFTPAGEWIPPTAFVPMLEEAGLIGEVGAWVFERAAADALWWRKQGLDIGRIGVNVSPVQLRNPDFLAWVLEQSRSWSAQGTAIDIELTESSVLKKPEHMVDGMEALLDANVRFALDDFGMGYSSLDLLMRLPVSYLKIDRGFVGNLSTSCKAASLIEAIVRMGHEIGVETIAEGIETAEQFRRLGGFGCDIGQGHYFCAAQPRDKLLKWLRSTPLFERHRPRVQLDDTFIPSQQRSLSIAIAAAGYDIV